VLVSPLIDKVLMQSLEDFRSKSRRLGLPLFPSVRVEVQQGTVVDGGSSTGGRTVLVPQGLAAVDAKTAPGANPSHGQAPVHVVNIDRKDDEMLAEQVYTSRPRANILVVVASRSLATTSASTTAVAQPVEKRGVHAVDRRLTRLS